MLKDRALAKRAMFSPLQIFGIDPFSINSQWYQLVFFNDYPTLTVPDDPVVLTAPEKFYSWSRWHGLRTQLHRIYLCSLSVKFDLEQKKKNKKTKNLQVFLYISDSKNCSGANICHINPASAKFLNIDLEIEWVDLWQLL